MFEKVQRVPRGGEKRQNIFKSGFEIYFSFYVENGLFSALCHLSRPENGAKVQNRVGLVCFELKTAKSAKSIGRASYAEAKKSAERSSKRRIELQKGGWHFVYFT